MLTSGQFRRGVWRTQGLVCRHRMHFAGTTRMGLGGADKQDNTNEEQDERPYSSYYPRC